MQKISWTDRVGNEEILHRDEGRNVLHKMKRRKTNFICRILHRKCLLKHSIEEKIEGVGRRGRRRKQLLNDLTKTRK